MKIIKEIVPYIVIIIVVLLIRVFIATPVLVDGPSMNPTLKKGDVMILSKLAKVNRYDIVVIKQDTMDTLIKRVIGLPGETIECIDGKILINGEEIEDVTEIKTNDFLQLTIPEDQYFVMGDNRVDSLDSRIIGPIREDSIEGTASFVIWPVKRFGTKK